MELAKIGLGHLDWLPTFLLLPFNQLRAEIDFVEFRVCPGSSAG